VCRQLISPTEVYSSEDSMELFQRNSAEDGQKRCTARYISRARRRAEKSTAQKHGQTSPAKIVSRQALTVKDKKTTRVSPSPPKIGVCHSKNENGAGDLSSVFGSSLGFMLQKAAGQPRAERQSGHIPMILKAVSEESLEPSTNGYSRIGGTRYTHWSSHALERPQLTSNHTHPL